MTTVVRLPFATLLLFISASPAFAQSERGWVDVNFGLAASTADEEAFAFATILFSEPAAFAAAYPQPSRGASFDFGGGYMFNERIGVGLSFSGTAHEDHAGLGATVPHPFFFNASTVASGATDRDLTRTEGGANIQMMFVPLHTARLRIRLFGGPTFFRLQAQMVRDIGFRQVALPLSRANLVTITSFEAIDAEGTGWGVHGGGDVSVFFTRVFGVGAFARISRGTVTVDEPLSEERQERTVGGVQYGGGCD